MYLRRATNCRPRSSRADIPLPAGPLPRPSRLLLTGTNSGTAGPSWFSKTAFVRDSPDLGADFKKMISGLEEEVFRRKRLLMNLTGDKKALNILSQEAEKLLGRIQAGGDVKIPGRPKLPKICEGIAIPAQVCYVAKVYPAPPYAAPVAPYLMLLSRVLASGILYNRIRVQGGAYGGMSLYDPLGGHFAFLSYRDPHLLQTLKVYREAIEATAEGHFSDEEVESALIGTIGSLDRPMDPSTKGYMSMIRRFAGITDQDRKMFRDTILGAQRENVIEAGRQCLAAMGERYAIAIYAAEGRLKEAAEKLGQGFKIEGLI